MTLGPCTEVGVVLGLAGMGWVDAGVRVGRSSVLCVA